MRNISSAVLKEHLRKYEGLVFGSDLIKTLSSFRGKTESSEARKRSVKKNREEKTWKCLQL